MQQREKRILEKLAEAREARNGAMKRFAEAQERLQNSRDRIVQLEADLRTAREQKNALPVTSSEEQPMKDSIEAIPTDTNTINPENSRNSSSEHQIDPPAMPDHRAEQQIPSPPVEVSAKSIGTPQSTHSTNGKPHSEEHSIVVDQTEQTEPLQEIAASDMYERSQPSAQSTAENDFTTRTPVTGHTQER